MPPYCRCPILLYTPLRCFPQSVPDRPAGNKSHYRSRHRLPYWNGQVPAFRWQHRWCTPQCCALRSRRFHLHHCLADMPFRRSLSYPASPALHPLPHGRHHRRLHRYDLRPDRIHPIPGKWMYRPFPSVHKQHTLLRQRNRCRNCSPHRSQ